jgi:hypothetical protein
MVKGRKMVLTTATVKNTVYDEEDSDDHEYSIITKEGIELVLYSKNYYKIGESLDITISGSNGTYVFSVS